MKRKSELMEYPVEITAYLLGSKWKLLIVEQLKDRPRRYSDLCESLAGISQKVLSENLKQMQDHGVVARVIYPEIPPRVEYSLTALGTELLPIIDSMAVWGEKCRKNLDSMRETSEERELPD
ncbi:MAG: helix-turn-helix transcriptional regulator [Candidatus Methanomethylophilaceae archaeon]|nr:helix-turn-helix transcriptional regulator [Candidatus Methanomethylophilaceae archaeon]